MKCSLITLLFFLANSVQAFSFFKDSFLKDQTLVAGAQTLKCQAYFFTNTNRRAPILLYLGGTGAYSVGDLQDRIWVEPLLRKDQMNVFSFDKPGITYQLGLTRNYVVNDALYNLHTQRDLVACAKNTLIWATRNNEQDIYIVGYSEGTQVATRLYQELLQERSPLAARVQAIFLSGIVMNPWLDDLNSNHGAETLKNFWQAYNQKDDARVRLYGDDLPFAYWEDIFKTEPMRDNYRQLAGQSPRAHFEFLQGLGDTTTPIQPILDFDDWNLRQKTNRQPHLTLSSRYYLANHSLSDTLFDDLYWRILSYLDPKPNSPAFIFTGL